MTRMDSVVKMFSALALVVIAPLSQAVLIDFTDDSWEGAINTGSTSTATIGGITLTASTSYLTFNAGDMGGCLSGQLATGLTCNGDGIGIRDDEISQGGVQRIVISFLSAVDIYGVHLLDLFGSDSRGGAVGEQAFVAAAGESVVAYTPSANNDGVAGGYWDTGFTASNVSSLMFYAADDGFSDFALARLDIGPGSVVVPEPGAIALLAVGVLGLGIGRRNCRQS